MDAVKEWREQIAGNLKLPRFVLLKAIWPSTSNPGLGHSFFKI